MNMTDQQRAEIKALADAVRSIANGCGSQRSFEQLCKASEAIPALLADLEDVESEAAFARNDRDHWKGLAKSRDELSEGLTNRIEQLDAELAAIEAARREERVEMRQIVEALESAGEMGDGEFRHCCMTRYGKPHTDWCGIGIALNACQNKGRTK